MELMCGVALPVVGVLLKALLLPAAVLPVAAVHLCASGREGELKCLRMLVVGGYVLLGVTAAFLVTMVLCL